MVKKKPNLLTPEAPPPDPSIWIDLDAIRLWPDNYNEGDVGAIVTMIRRFGFNGSPSIWKESECRAGNHSTMALREIKQTGPLFEDETYPPKNVIAQGDKWYIHYTNISHLNPIEATAYAIADNNAARLASVNEELLYKYLVTLSQEEPQLFEATGYDTDQMTSLLEGFTGDTFAGTADPDDDSDDEDPSDGSLLKLVGVTIGEPRHEVHAHEIYILGDRHFLCCCNLLTEWGMWAAFLKGDAIFCPLPGPFAVLGHVASEHPLVMVQPDVYIAGHILDQFENVNGEGSVKRYA